MMNDLQGRIGMEGVIIRKFKHTDVDDFIRLSQSSFAEESVASGLTPEDFEQETRRIFRWNMIPYKVLTALMGIKWEGFVAEKAGKVVGGGMYMGRDNRMELSNLMVDPQFQRQGIGQALLLKRLERLSELGFPFVTTEVLETNTASLANISKQGFELFNRYSVYEHGLPIPDDHSTSQPGIILRDTRREDRVWFKEIEARTTPPMVLHIDGSQESRHFLNFWQRLYLRYTHSSKWIKSLVVGGERLGFVVVDFQAQQHKGFMLDPVLTDACVPYLPELLREAGVWLSLSGKASMVMEIPDRREQISGYLLEHGWVKQYTWLGFIKWLDERAKQEITSRYASETG
jgi:ribosomal protein S18 acetylase RimI-like enzyme